MIFMPIDDKPMTMKNRMFHSLAAAAAVLTLASCHTPMLIEELTVTNDLDFEREGEVVEIPAAQARAIAQKAGGTACCIVDAKGQKQPLQLTHDGSLLFAATVGARGKATYRIVRGEAPVADIIVYGRLFPERSDDFAWENDRAAYRAYGPALQRRGEKAYGYDVFTKSVSRPVLEERYRMELDQDAWDKINAWRRAGQKERGDSLERIISYHVDHGNGMDVYSVGPTLGGGTAALLDSKGDIVYPWCFDKAEILDQGPLRLTFRLTYKPIEADGQKGVVETRVISLDKGDFLNKTTVGYANLQHAMPVACGIVLHKENPNGAVNNTREGYIAYADSTDNAHVGNGVIYLGAVGAKGFERTEVSKGDAEWSSKHGGALGHVLGIGRVEPGGTFTYYWGSGWSKSNVESYDQWQTYLSRYARRVKSPLKLTMKN